MTTYAAVKNGFVGRDRAISVRLLALSVVLFVVLFALTFLGKTTNVDVLPSISQESAALVVLVLAAAGAYRNDGLLVSWALAFAPLFGAFLNNYLFGRFYEPPIGELVVESAGFALLVAFTVGTLGFVFGAVAWRLVRRLPLELG